MKPEPRCYLSPRRGTDDIVTDCTSWHSVRYLYCMAVLVLPEGHKDGVPFLMDDNLLRQDRL